MSIEHDPAAILSEYDRAWQELERVIGGLSEQEMLAPNHAGAWSRKDVLAHIGRWDDAGCEVIEDHMAGGKLAEQYRDFEPWNARWAAEDSARTLQEVLTRARAAHERMRALIASLSADRWDALVYEWAGVGIEHIDEHLVDLRA